MLSRFFLDRPVFAWVIAIIMMVLGGLAIYNLPISQYPPIAPPSIAIDAFYPGASAETVENSVTQIIEQKMTGFDNMLYLSATSDSAGASRIELTFKPGTDPDLAWAKVQNKLQLAMASLPEVVQRPGVTVSKSTRNYLIIVGLISEDGSMDGNDLRDYAQSNLEKVLARVPGVGEVENFGTQYAMRIWLNPDKLTDYHLTVEDVIAALQAYNVEVSAGQFGGAPAVEGQRLNASIIVQNLLKTPEEFAAIPLRTNPDGSIVRIKDVGRTELGTEFYDIEVFYNGKPSAGMAIRQAAGANALDTADAVKKKTGGDEPLLPAGDEGRLSLRHHPLHQGGHRGGGQDPVRGDPAGLPGHVAVHGEHPGHPDPHHRGAGGAPGDLRRAGAVRVLHQHADHVRHGAGHRPAGGRRHRGGGKRGADHERGRAFAPGGHRQVHGPDHQRPDRHRPGALGGVRPHGLLRRLHRRHLPPVLRDHHRLHAAFGGGGPDPDAGALRLAPQAGGQGA